MHATAVAFDPPLKADQRTFEACFKAHRHRVYRLGLRYGRGSTSWAEDLTQDVFMKLLEELPQLTEHDDLGGWIYRVTTNAALSRLRREKSLVGRVERMWAVADVEGQSSPERRVESSELAKEAQALLDALPAKERVVLAMKVLDGKAQRDIARDLGMSEGYVSKLLTRAWERIRKAGWEVSDEQA